MLFAVSDWKVGDGIHERREVFRAAGGFAGLEGGVLGGRADGGRCGGSKHRELDGVRRGVRAWRVVGEEPSSAWPPCC